MTFVERRINNVTKQKNRAYMGNKVWHIVRSAKIMIESITAIVDQTLLGLTSLDDIRWYAQVK